MKQHLSKTVAGLGLLMASLAFTSCSTNGPAFTPVSPPPGKGVVYIYRQPSIAGCAVSGTVKANGVPVTSIKNGGYFPYLGLPGSTRFTVTTEATNEATVRIEAGKEKYLKTTIGMGVLVGRLKLTEVTQDAGKSEIGACKLLPPASP